ncbi:acyl-coenzyme A thioesterase PaaI-like protein [Mycobacterium frederiksbergense]|uniref:Acyl-coenzyme A thioesterase PaaI-like protein n=1 Tax=Mycolicibacterium frederiksbergense TaxID=117567 RepID=A0ABT6KWY4_9MYCO|nr:YiiD C-terminal domain-containing protein [Mycolicibacterium frederiksbergense]MDH6195222.1 acyl-coenzyme A thioesterase PaaI-like protein [Mycolicibacterium frederiksbergense]
MAATEKMTNMPWITWLDLDTEFGPDGSLQVILRRPKPEHLNHNNHVNAPVIYGVAEVAGAGAVVIAAGSDGQGAYTVIRDATIKYSRPAHGGVTAAAKLDPVSAERMREELRAGRGYDATVQVTLTDAENTPTGTCDFTVTLRAPRNRDESR